MVRHRTRHARTGRCARRWLRVRRPTGDDGFSLLEALVAITLVTIVMAGLTTLYVTTMSSMTSLRATQASARMATDAIDHARALGASDALSGRGSAAVNHQFETAPDAVRPWLATMDEASDTMAPATAGATANLPTEPLRRVIDQIDYDVSYYVGICQRERALGDDDGDCVPAAAAGPDTVRYVRVVVAIAWTHPSCGDDGCSHVSAVLLNSDSDPVFNFNLAPPPEPELDGCVDQIWVVGDRFEATAQTWDLPVLRPADAAETDPLLPADLGCALDDGVPRFSFALADPVGRPLPAGLALDGQGAVAGVIEGDPTHGPAGDPAGYPKTYPGTQIVVTDAFLRQAESNPFTWTVHGPLTIDATDGFAAVSGTELEPFTLTATGGVGGPYTWSAAGLPPGMSLDTGTGEISGTPAAAGDYEVTATVRDGDTRRVREATATATWTIFDPLTINHPGNQAGNVGDPVDLPLPIDGGSGEYTVTATGLPDGLTLVRTGDGTRLVGTLATAGFPVATIHVEDVHPAVPDLEETVRWAIADGGPAIADPGDQHHYLGDEVSLPLLSVCGPYPACTWAQTGALPTGIAFDEATGAFTGTAAAVGTWSGITVTYTDSRGVGEAGEAGEDAPETPGGSEPPSPQTAAVTFDWTVEQELALAAIGNQRTAVGTPAQVIPAVTESVGALTFTAETTRVEVDGDGDGGVDGATGLPAGLTLNPTTGKIGGAPSAAGIYDVTLTVTSAAGSTDSTSFTWYVPALDVPTQGCLAVDSGTGRCDSRTTGNWGNRTTYWSQEIDLAGFAASTGPGNPTYGVSTASGAVTATRSGSRIILETATPGTHTITAAVTGTGGGAPDATATATFTWAVYATPLALTAAPRSVYIGQHASLDLGTVVSGGVAPYAFTVGSHAWLELAADGHTLTGTAPASAGNTQISVTVTDALGTSVTRDLPWSVTGLAGKLESDRYPGRCLDRDGSDIVLSENCNSASTWTLTAAGELRTGSGYSTRCLTTAASGSTPSATSCDQRTQQRWEVGGDGGFTLRSVSNNLAIEAIRTGSRQRGYHYFARMANASSDPALLWTIR